MRRNPFHHPTKGVGLQAKIVIHRALRERRTRFVSEKSREQLIRPAKPGHRVHHLAVTAQFQIKRAAPIRADADPAKRFPRQQRRPGFGIQRFKPSQHQMQAGAAFQDDDLPEAPEGASKYRAPAAGADHPRTARC
jgi:hypothetical protein